MKKIFIAIALLFSLTLTSVNAVEVTVEEKITGLYVAYFNRAADQAGLEYWTNKADEVAQQGGDVSSVFKTLSGGFATHPTFTSTYAHLTNEEFVAAIYRNALGRDGDAQGIAYWTDLVDRAMSRSDMVATFVELAMVTDLTPENYPDLPTEELAAGQLRQDLISNKVTVSVAFTHQLGTSSNVNDSLHPEQDPAYIASIMIISGVTEDKATVASGLRFLEGIIGDDDPVRQIFKARLYDEDGNLLTSIDVNSDGTYRSRTTTYNSDKEKETDVRTSYDVNGTVDTISKDTYDENGNKLTYEYKSIESDGTWRKSTTTYDTDGKEVASRTENSDGTYDSTTYIHNADGSTATRTENSDGTYETETITHHSNGGIATIGRTAYRADASVWYTCLSIFGENGNMSKHECKFINLDGTWTKYTTTYDTDGNEIDKKIEEG